jgi:NhaP-type Na+/H+ or K+/H+ antiporter
MSFALWLALGGALLLFMALSGSLLSRMPVSTSMLYLAAGLVAGPLGLALAAPDLVQHAALLEHLSEVIVLLSLFTSGMKMSVGLQNRRWFPPLRLALVSMVVTVLLITAAGVWLLGLPLGAAVLLGGILAPTDPVLATEVQVDDLADRDQLRFALTGEGGLNDGTAFPVVMLGLGLLGVHELGAFAWRWVLVDVLWATAAGLAIGGLLGAGLGRLVLHLRQHYQEARGYENFLALGLIGLAYGFALLAHGYGFLAVFAAGLALRHAAREGTGEAESMAQAVLGFNEQLDRIGEMAGVVVLGLLLWAVPWLPAAAWFVPFMLLLVRPLSVAAGLAGSRISPVQRGLIAWFGIRGIGSLYYLSFAIHQGLPAQHVNTLVALTMAVVVTSIVVHGVSVTPLMARYRRRRRT